MTAPESQVIQLDVCGNAGSKLVVIQANGLRIISEGLGLTDSNK